jgi:hypothetical protein
MRTVRDNIQSVLSHASRRRPDFAERPAYTLGQNERILSQKIVFAGKGQNSAERFEVEKRAALTAVAAIKAAW